jgi:hypothetical protein
LKICRIKSGSTIIISIQHISEGSIALIKACEKLKSAKHPS